MNVEDLDAGNKPAPQNSRAQSGIVVFHSSALPDEEPICRRTSHRGTPEDAGIYYWNFHFPALSGPSEDLPEKLGPRSSRAARRLPGPDGTRLPSPVEE